MKIEQENKDAMSFLELTYMTQRSKTLLDYAKKTGLEKATITLANGQVHAASAYAQHLYCAAHEIGNPDDRMNESYQIVTLLIVMEDIMQNNWHYGTQLLYRLRSEGFQLKRTEVAAFLAQEGSFESNRDKYALMENNPMAVSMYCGRLKALYNSLPGLTRGITAGNGEPMHEFLTAREESALETIEKLTKEFIPAFIGAENEPKLEKFLIWLRSTDYYSAPASTHGARSVPGGLAEQKVDIIYNTARLFLPATKAQIGEIVMAALLCDLHKIHVFHPDEDGGYYFHDEMPFGHGRKSLYMASGFFGNAIPESVACAIDCYLHDESSNPNIGLQMMEQPLGLFLHIGEIMATFLGGTVNG